MPGWLRVLAGIACVACAVSAQVAYNSIPSPLPGNVPSEGPEAYAFSELGDGVILTSGLGIGSSLTTVKVIMSDWACQTGHWNNAAGARGACVTTPGATFSQPITMNIYAVVPGAPPTPGALLATQTKTFQIAYRPSADATHCPGTGAWFSAADNKCYNGIALPIVFDFSAAHLTLPNEVIVTLVYNTSDYGPTPLRPQPCNSAGGDDNCPYDALNISTSGSAIVGANLDPSGIWVNYTLPANSCSGTATPGLKDDQGCWAGYHPEIEIDVQTAQTVYQTRYLANLNIADSYVNLTNTGTLSGPDPAGQLCANVYVFDPNEEPVSCCACPVTPNGLVSLSGKNDLIVNPVTPGIPNAVVVKVLFSANTAGAKCNAGAVTAANLARGGIAWATTIHANTSTSPAAYQLTETPFDNSELSDSEFSKLVGLCNIIQTNFSGYGLCKSCRGGALGAVKQ